MADPGYLEEIETFLRDYFEFALDSTYKELRVNFVFYTWVAVYGTGIPDGSKPFRGKDLNYVSKIKEQARTMRGQKIPNAIVYSRLQMPVDEEIGLKEHFDKEDNIVLLCLEDIPDCIPPESYQDDYTADLALMDCLRVVVIKHAGAVRNKLKEKASLERKRQYVSFLDGNGGNAVMYADMDIVFTCDKVPTVYAKDGLCSYPELHKVFLGDPHVERPPWLKEKMAKHAAVFRRDWKDIAQYIICDGGYAVAADIYKDLGRQYKPCVATGENCMLLVAYESVPLFWRLVSNSSLIIDLHSIDTPLRCENHTLIYLQLLPYMVHRGDRTWYKSSQP
ncbi:ORF071 [Infectious spleen and kidney necrosis virus]|nr:ORF071 [Infectious spleen and kidney necrosis virus]